MLKQTIPASRLLFIGAHPDDAEFSAGGLMCKWHDLGGDVHILSLTDGCAGHHQLEPAELRKRRHTEAHRAARTIQANLHIWQNLDGELIPSVDNRQRLIRAIRQIKPDLIVTHRPADYHPDHRATAQLVQDACYLLQVPNIQPQVKALSAIPAVIYTADSFTYPKPFRADWVVDTGEYIDRVVDMLDCHASQVYEWLPHTLGVSQQVPDPSVQSQQAKAWLKKWYAKRPRSFAGKFSPGIEYVEAFEISEYGGHFIDPFSPSKINH